MCLLYSSYLSALHIYRQIITAHAPPSLRNLHLLFRLPQGPSIPHLLHMDDIAWESSFSSSLCGEHPPVCGRIDTLSIPIDVSVLNVPSNTSLGLATMRKPRGSWAFHCPSDLLRPLLRNTCCHFLGHFPSYLYRFIILHHKARDKYKNYARCDYDDPIASTMNTG